MPGHHVVTYSATMPTDVGGVSIPGHVYFVSTPAHRYSSYEVYSQRSPSRYPVMNAQFHGTVSGLTTPLPYYPRRDFEVCFYYANYYGLVDCYIWRHGYHPELWAHYEVEDISTPNDWWRGSRYRFVRIVEFQPLSKRARALGLSRFYRHMPDEDED